MPGTMFVTGGSGFLGRRVMRVAAAAGWTVVAPGHAELDVRSDRDVARLVGRARPSSVVHLAYRATERDTIVDGSAHVAASAREVGARLVHLSTDVVFAGRPEPYHEADPPDPVFPYGEAKATAEAEVAAIAPDAVLVRTSLLYSASPTDLATCQRDVLADGFTFFTDEVRSPACVDDVAAAVVELAGRHTAVHGPLHVAGPDPWARDSFARAIARWLGRDPANLHTARCEDLGLVRPGRVVLDVGAAEGLGLRCRPVSEVLRPRSS